MYTVIRQPQLPVERPLYKKTADVVNHESESLSPPHDESSLPKFSSVSGNYDHIIRCHLSLPALPRERFAKVAQPRCTNTVPVVRPFAVVIARRPAKHVSRRGPDEGRTKTKWRGLCGPKSVVENKKRAEAWERIWRSPDDAAESQSIADGMHGSERTWWSQPVESLTHRLERIELLNDQRDELLLLCAQSRRLLESFLCRTWRDVASFQPFGAARAQGKAYNEAARGQRKHQMGMSVFAAFVNGLTTETLGATGLEEVEMAWLHEFRKKLSQHWTWVVFSRCGTFARPTRKGNQYALWYDTGCAHQILLSQRMHRAPPNWHTSYAKPSTADEQRAENSESTREQRRKRAEGKYAQGMRLTSMRLISKNRWPYGVLERKTRSSNELLYFSSGLTPLISCEEF